MILVTGATGTVGRALIDALAPTGEPVRAMTRRPDSAALPAHVEVVAGDLDDPDSLTDAVRDVDRVFLVSTGPDGPVQDRNLATAAAKAGAARIVKLSTLSVGDHRIDDPITRWHRAGEDAVLDGGVPATFMRPTGFMSNALTWARTIAAQDTVFHPYADGRVSLIDPRDIAAATATVLTQPGHEGQAYPLCGPEALGPADEVAALAEVLGRPLRYVEVSPEAAHRAMTEHGMPAELADAVVAKGATTLQPGVAGPDDELRRLIATAPRTFREWARDHVGAFVR
ncbi:NAD(P)H-binding protein [Actinomycetospora endophytica]|uniref:NAD(P)H-binding protein n=1 Tax=Actinomycetospora endophytica TaxID=2291215 RepID=A0ABS8PFE3_9PSEU|nr:NAD(P)H-binding protein [Actinomycetospora endophytica]MCD2196953.1 NAD(P)H-binding protein [Actinomycetospora endophytica]